MITIREIIYNVEETTDDNVQYDEDSNENFIAGFEINKAFDAEKTGYISQRELKDILTSLGDKLNDEEINEMFMLVDVDKEGRINYEGFIKQFVVEK